MKIPVSALKKETSEKKKGAKKGMKLSNLKGGKKTTDNDKDDY